MTLKFRNKYRIPSARLRNWDYGNNGAYFITICTFNRAHFFGEIQNGEMQLKDIGKLAEKYWMEIPDHFPFVQLSNFVVMPNHVHGILIIDKTDRHGSNDGHVVETLHCNVSTTNKMQSHVSTNTLHCNVSTNKMQSNLSTNTSHCNVLTPNDNVNEQMAKISPKPGSISTIIRSYKSVVSKNARFIDADFAWQSRFLDHIIRNYSEFEIIHNYISKNPINW